MSSSIVFLELTETNGEKVIVQANHIIKVNKGGSGQYNWTKITLIDDKIQEVKETRDQIMAHLSEQFKVIS